MQPLRFTKGAVCCKLIDEQILTHFDVEQKPSAMVLYLLFCLFFY